MLATLLSCTLYMHGLDVYLEGHSTSAGIQSLEADRRSESLQADDAYRLPCRVSPLTAAGEQATTVNLFH